LAQPVVWPSSFMMVGTDEEVEAEAFPGQLRQDFHTLHATVSELRPQRFTAGSLDDRSLRIDASAMLDWLIEDAPNLTIRLAEPVCIGPLGLVPLRRTAAVLETDTPIAPDRCMVMKIGGYYYRYEDSSAILASPQDSVPSIAEDAQPHRSDIDAMIDQIHADTTLNITGVRSSWTGLRTESSDGVPVLGFDEHPGFFWLAGQS